MPAAASPLPTRSKRGRRRGRDSGISRAAPTAASNPSGRLTKNTSRQPVPSRFASIRAPPRIGPSIAEMPITGPNTEKAVPCWSSPKTLQTIPRPCGTSSAAAIPCASRQAINIASLFARPHADEAATNPTAPITNSRRRP